MDNKVNSALRSYIETEIIPLYDAFDKAHRRDHVLTVIEQSLSLAQYFDVDINIVYTAAAFHDTGLSVDRKTHHLESGRIIREAQALRQWFSEQDIEIIAQAAEDHRASSKTAPRSDYGRILAEADRVIDPITIIRRTIQFGLSNYTEHSKEEHWERTVEHLLEKYAEGGYLKLWVPQSPNAARLEELRSIIRDRSLLGTIFEKLFNEENQ